MTNHPAVRAALVAATGTLALMAAACGAGTGALSGPAISASPSVGAGEVTAGDTGNGGGTTTSPAPATSPTPKTNTTAAASGPVIVYFKVSGNASCSESGPGFSAPGTVTLSWKVTGATKVGLSINDPTFYSRFGKGSFSDYPASDTQTIPFSCNVKTGETATNQYTLDTLDGGAHKSMTIKASAVNHA
jgi:hypothetical protein